MKIQTNISIRIAKTSDADQLVEMINALAKHHNDIAKIEKKHLKRDVFAAKPWMHILVATQHETLLGYSALCPLAQLQWGERGVDIHHLFVNLCHRGQGIGRLLLQTSMEYARDELDCSYARVGTHPENLEAQLFYRKYGLEERTGTHPRFGKRLK